MDVFFQRSLEYHIISVGKKQLLSLRENDFCTEESLRRNRGEAVTGRLPFPTFLSGDENIASAKGRKF